MYIFIKDNKFFIPGIVNYAGHEKYMVKYETVHGTEMDMVDGNDLLILDEKTFIKQIYNSIYRSEKSTVEARDLGKYRKKVTLLLDVHGVLYKYRMGRYVSMTFTCDDALLRYPLPMKFILSPSFSLYSIEQDRPKKVRASNSECPMHRVVLDFLDEPKTTYDISKESGYDINRISGRVSELARMGRVISVGRELNKDTGQMCKLWVKVNCKSPDDEGK